MYSQFKRFNLALITFLGLFTGTIEGGAILNMYRIDLLNGKRIILFGEQHQGEIETSQRMIPVTAVEANQHVALFNLFKNYFGPRRDLITTYLECNDELCTEFKEKMIKRLSSNDPELTRKMTFESMSKSWFDHYYQILYAMGSTSGAHIASIKNFDPRTTLDLALLFLAINFSEFLEGYENSNYDQAYFNKAKKEFFASPEYTIFKAHEKSWLKEITQPVVDKIIALQKRINPAISQEMLNKTIEKNIMLSNLRWKAEMLHEDIFQFLFTMVEFLKQDFKKTLPDLVSVDHPVTVWDIFELCNLIADFHLVEQIINDTHPVILIHGGNKHIQAAYRYFQMMPAYLGIRTKTINLITWPLLNNEETYQLMRQFIEQ